MSVKKEDLGGSRVRLTITVSPEVFQRSIDEAYRKTRSSYSMPGFRKGNVPRAIIEASNGPDTFYGPALELLIPDSLQNAYDEADLTVVSDADITSIESMDRNTGVTYIAEVYVMPEVVLGQYEGIDAEQRNYTVSDDDVDDEIERVRREGARWIPVERAAADGDTVTISYVGKVEGEEFDGGKGENFRVTLGSGQLIPGFEEGLAGAVPGETRVVEVTFPDNYDETSLAGKPATFDVTVHEVAEQELPELDDDFAQDVSGYDTMSEYREDVRSTLQAAYDSKRDSDVEAQIVSEIVKRSSVEIPPPMIAKETERQLLLLQIELSRQGFGIDTYLQLRGISREEMLQELAGRAEQSVRASLVLSKLVDVLEAAATDENTDEELRRIAERNGVAFDEFTEKTSAEQRETLKERLSYTNLLNKLRSLSNITEIEVDSIDQRVADQNDITKSDTDNTETLAEDIN